MTGNTPEADKLVPDAFEKYEKCSDCEVTVHGPQHVNSSGGCHVIFCPEHGDDFE